MNKLATAVAKLVKSKEKEKEDEKAESDKPAKSVKAKEAMPGMGGYAIQKKASDDLIRRVTPLVRKILNAKQSTKDDFSRR